MKTCKSSIVYLLMFAGIVFASCNNSNPDNNDSGLAEYSVLVYGNAGGGMDRIMESAFEKSIPVMTSEKVRLAILYKYGKDSTMQTQDDGTEKMEYTFSGKYADPGQLVFFELNNKTDLSQLREASVTWPDFELFDPACLAAALDTLKKRMPAKQYILIIYGHGGGFDENADYPKEWRKDVSGRRRAVLYDEWFRTGYRSESEGMNMYELTEALGETEIENLKAIFFHNCLMGNMETLDNIYPYADYLLTSMHALAGNSILLVELLKALYQNTDFEQAAMQMFKTAVPSWREDYHSDDEDVNGDINLIKASEFPKLEPLFEKLAKRLIELYPTQKEAIDRAADKTYKICKSYNFFDALDYADKVAAETGDEQLKLIADDIRDTFRKVIIHSEGVHLNKEAPLDNFTLSIVLTDKEGYNKQTHWGYTFANAYSFTGFDLMTNWGDWLNTCTHAPTGNPTGQPL